MAGVTLEARRLTKRFGTRRRLGGYGVHEEDLPGLVRAATGSQRSTNAPVGLAEAEVLPWLRKVR
jgi:alcohol dehydrogenase class IV